MNNRQLFEDINSLESSDNGGEIIIPLKNTVSDRSRTARKEITTIKVIICITKYKDIMAMIINNCNIKKGVTVCTFRFVSG